jgi:hypothetical protein
MAAAVAIAAIVGLQTLFGERGGDEVRVVQSTPPAVVAQPTIVAERPTAGQPLTAAGVRLNNYLVTHSEHAAHPGMLPQVRVVGYAQAGD